MQYSDNKGEVTADVIPTPMPVPSEMNMVAQIEPYVHTQQRHAGQDALMMIIFTVWVLHALVLRTMAAVHVALTVIWGNVAIDRQIQPPACPCSSL